MSDARDTRGLPEEGFHEIQLSGKQLVFLFMATTVVSVVIFLCGVLVGRGVRSQPAATAEAGAVGLPAGDAAGDGPADAAGADPTADAAPAPRDAAPPAEELTYYERLSSEKPPGEAVGRKQDEPARPAPSEPGGKADSSEPPPAASGGTTTSPPAAARTEPVAAPAAGVAPAAAAPARGQTDAPFTVQVAALRERAEAESIVRRLAGRGYDAYIVDPQPGSPPMYRVRVGRFADRSEAERVMRRLAQEERFKPWITR
jgi:cell division septation protein DedD